MTPAREILPPLADRVRPATVTEFIGQSHLVGTGSLLRRAILENNLFSMILWGPPGTGKTTLAKIIARETKADFYQMSAVSSGVREVRRILKAGRENFKMAKHTVFFIDEIHRLNRVVEEVLYSAMEDFFLSWMVGKGLAARNVNLRINPFTLIGATTRYSMISAPLRDRFGSVFRLEYYDTSEMKVIVQRSARILDVEADQQGVDEIACRSRGTPRIANRLLKRSRDFALVKADNRVTGPVARDALAQLQVDELGLDQSDRRLLESIIDKFSGGPVGLETLAASIHEDSDTIMDVWEPYLLQLGFIDRTPRGRVATKLAHDYLGRPYSKLDPRDQARLSGF